MGLLGRAAAVGAASLLVAGCGGGGKNAATTATTSPTTSTTDSASGERNAAPLDVRDEGRANGPYPIAIRKISYVVGRGRVQAFLAVPPRRGRVPAVIFLHGSGGDRLQLLTPAVWLAGRRAVGMTLTLPSSKPQASSKRLTPAQTLAREQQQFADDEDAVRRAIDLLRRRPDVDPNRIGLVGWSYGGKVGAVLAGAESRIRDFVLVSTGATPVSTYVAQAPASLRARVRQTLTAIDPLRWIAKARPGTILLQDGRKDAVVPKKALQAIVAAAPKGTEVRWYKAGHGLTLKAFDDQLDWLARKLPITGPAVAGAKTGP
jgi:dienelactone hydrolase